VRSRESGGNSAIPRPQPLQRLIVAAVGAQPFGYPQHVVAAGHVPGQDLDQRVCAPEYSASCSIRQVTTNRRPPYSCGFLGGRSCTPLDQLPIASHTGRPEYGSYPGEPSGTPRSHWPAPGRPAARQRDRIGHAAEQASRWISPARSITSRRPPSESSTCSAAPSASPARTRPGSPLLPENPRRPAPPRRPVPRRPDGSTSRPRVSTKSLISIARSRRCRAPGRRRRHRCRAAATSSRARSSGSARAAVSNSSASQAGSCPRRNPATARRDRPGPGLTYSPPDCNQARAAATQCLQNTPPARTGTSTGQPVPSR